MDIAPSALTAGTHLVTPRRAYLHHGIYVGNGKVIHYAGLADRFRGGPVEVISIDAFTQGYSLWAVSGRVSRFTPEEVVRRAMSRLGENRYHLLKNNCEHFCEWCLRAEHRSYQVDRLLAVPRRMFEAASNLATNVLGAAGCRRQARDTLFV
ncbi:MAG TPA: lecithin retinol acyltransferase family protein [Steroidobacter sp.]